MTPWASTPPHQADTAGTLHAAVPAPDRLLDMAMAFWRSSVLLGAHELGLFRALAEGQCDAAEAGTRVRLRTDTIVDLLDALVALGLVEQCGGLYRNTQEARLFLDPASQSYIGPWLAMARAAMDAMIDTTGSSVRAALGDEQSCASSRTERLWADIAEILRAAGAHEA